MPKDTLEQRLPDRFGCLFKQSTYLARWNRRVFAIKDGFLCYFITDDSLDDMDWNAMPFGIMTINSDLRMNDVIRPKGKKIHVLSVSDSSEGGLTWNIGFDTLEEKQDWHQFIDGIRKQRLATQAEANARALAKNVLRNAKLDPFGEMASLQFPCKLTVMVKQTKVRDQLETNGGNCVRMMEKGDVVKAFEQGTDAAGNIRVRLQ
jgi:hypothetical protein